MKNRNEKYNSSGCKDLTPYLALRNIESEQRLKKFLKEVFKLSEKYDFHIDERLVVTDKKTGKKWR